MAWSRKHYSILTMAAVTAFMGTFLISSVNIALPVIETEFGLDAVRLSWLITAFLLASAIFLLPAGRIGDSQGIRRLFKIGVVVFTVSSLLCAVALSGNMLIAFRFLQGAGAALINTAGPAILVSAFPPTHRGRVLGITISAVYLGLATGPLLGGLITQVMGWRAIFYISTAIGLVTMLLAFMVLGKDLDKPSPKAIHLKGLLFYMPGLVLLVYGTSHIPDWSGWLLLLLGIGLLTGFWIHEQHNRAPVFDTRLFSRNRLFAYSNLAALINYSATFAIVFFLSLYLQKIQALSPREAGTILIAQPLTMAVFSPLAGRLADKIQVRILASIGMGMCAIGLLAFSLTGTQTPIWAIVAVLIWVGLGFAFFSSPNMSTIMGSVDKTQYGLASGTSATMRVLGQMVSITIATIFFALFFEDHSVMEVSDETFIRAMSLGFLTFSLICAAGVYFSFYRGKVAFDREEET